MSTQSSSATRSERDRGRAGNSMKIEDERDEQKADAIDLRLDDEEDPVERIERESDREHRRDAGETIPGARVPCDS